MSMLTNNLFMTGLLCVWYAISATANPRYRNQWGRSVISSRDLRPLTAGSARGTCPASRGRRFLAPQAAPRNPPPRCGSPVRRHQTGRTRPATTGGVPASQEHPGAKPAEAPPDGRKPRAGGTQVAGSTGRGPRGTFAGRSRVSPGRGLRGGTPEAEPEACALAEAAEPSPAPAGQASGPWCRTSFPFTMKMTSSQMFVAWSATRSRCRDTRIRSIALGMVVGSEIM
jgi:hypothetical protein